MAICKGTRRIDAVEVFNSCRRKSSPIVHEALGHQVEHRYDVADRISKLDFDFCKKSIWKHRRTHSLIRDPRWPSFMKAL